MHTVQVSPFDFANVDVPRNNSHFTQTGALFHISNLRLPFEIILIPAIIPRNRVLNLSQHIIWRIARRIDEAIPAEAQLFEKGGRHREVCEGSKESIH